MGGWSCKRHRARENLRIPMKQVNGGWALGIALSILFATPTAFARIPHDQTTSDGKRADAGSAKNSDYVGAEVCKTCHEEIYSGWEKTPHWKTTLDTKGGPSHQGCEGCHGPGLAHVAGGGDITKIFIFKDAASKEI